MNKNIETLKIRRQNLKANILAMRTVISQSERVIDLLDACIDNPTDDNLSILERYDYFMEKLMNQYSE